MSDPYVLLTRAGHSVQKSLIEQILRTEGIAFDCVDRSMSVILGSNPPMGYQEFRVSPERLHEAKDALCAGGVVCEVSHRLLNRTIEEVIEPLLESDSRVFNHLVQLIEINNKETVHAIFQRTFQLEGGRELLENLFFELARTSSAGLFALARALGGSSGGSFDRSFDGSFDGSFGGTSFGFLQRYQESAIAGDKQTRMALLGVLHDFASRELHRRVMAVALTDSDFDIRDAAAEALLSLTESACDYDPTDPPHDRLRVVERILGSRLQPAPGSG